jgi:hypothetical protein
MSTLIEDLQEEIPRLRAKGTDSANRLADDFQMQLDTYLANPNGSARETYFSGNPVAKGSALPKNLAAPQSSSPSDPEPMMKGAREAYEQALTEHGNKILQQLSGGECGIVFLLRGWQGAA